MEKDWQATVIKILAVVTATPRWVGALLAAEGLIIPADWLWWVTVSAIMSAAMAAVEGWAFSYVFEAWRNQEDTKSNRLGWMILAAAILFVIVLAPYIATSVTHQPLSATLDNPAALYVWSVAVGGSTIAIVASVGYAQKHKAVKRAQPAETKTATTTQPVAQPVAADKRTRILELHHAQPDAKPAAIAQQVGVTRQYVDRVISQNGKVKEQQ